MSKIKYVVPMLCSFSSLLIAKDKDKDPCYPDPCCCETPCPDKDPCAKCAQLWPGGGPDWIITPGAGPCVSCGDDVFVTAEFIYWTAREDNLDFAFTNLETVNQTSTSGVKGKFYHADGKMEPGFKVGLGMLFDCDGWDLYANYTYLKTEKRRRASSPDGLNLFLIVANPQDNLSTTFQSITSKWRHSFNVIDLELGRNFFISSCLHLRPHFGLKATWQSQDWDITGLQSSTVEQVGNLDLDYWGIGIRTGLDTAWHLTRCISIVGEAAASVLWERFNSKEFTYGHNFSSDLFSMDANQQNIFHGLRSILEVYLGLRWEDWFCCDEYHYSIEAAWEMQWWGDQNQFRKIPAYPLTAGGDLGLQGLTIKARLDF